MISVNSPLCTLSWYLSLLKISLSFVSGTRRRNAFAMNSSLAEFVLTQVKHCAEGNISADDLHEYLAPIVWELDTINDNKLRGLVYSAELLLSEFGAGHRDETDFRSNLNSLVAYHSPVATATNFSATAFLGDFSRPSRPLARNGFAAAS